MHNATVAFTQQFLTFHIGAEEYAISILRVREILPFTLITRVPGMPACVRGVLNLRGVVLPVVDLAVRFGMPEREFTGRSCVIIVEIEFDGSPMTVGVVADSVDEVVDVTEDQIEPPPRFGAAQLDHLTGFVRAQHGLVMLLNIDRALSAEVLANVGSLNAAAVPDVPQSDVATAITNLDAEAAQ